jgi:hypothetical protein
MVYEARGAPRGAARLDDGAEGAYSMAECFSEPVTGTWIRVVGCERGAGCGVRGPNNIRDVFLK